MSDENPQEKLVIRLQAPKFNATSEDYECGYEITGKGVKVSRYAAGADGIQSLQLAFVMIRAEISAIEKAAGITFRFGDCKHSGFDR